MKYNPSQVYGPVPSRRLGRSLGVDLVPPKTCPYDCIYCQAGRTDNHSIEPVGFFPLEEVVAVVTDRLKSIPAPDFITFSGNGEPTLNSDIGVIIDKLKKLTSIPVAVITNGALLHRQDVVERILRAEVVMPSLDAAAPEAFRRVNRPHPELSIELVIDGLKRFSHMYRGRLLLEVMLVRGVNDSPEEIEKMIEIIRGLRLETVQLNTVVRPPSESSAEALDKTELETIHGRFADAGIPCEIIAEFKGGEVGEKKSPDSRAVLDLLGRRPCTLGEMAASLGYDETDVKAVVEKLLHLGHITIRITAGKTYYGGK